MSEPLERFKMETNFEGLIHLLAKHLYPEPDVFVRELIQNAHDSIQRRRQVEPDLAGSIDIEHNIEARTITFRDNGIGMDRQDIKEFLAVIGSTGTGVARQELQEQGVGAAYELIGQFGIGMLSAFVIAEKVIVRTRKLNSPEAFAWHNAGSTDCELYPDDKEHVGSEIIVFVDQNYTFMLDEKRLRETIIRYCDFIPFPISLNGRGPINVIEAPWHRTHWSSEDEKKASYDAFLNRRYPDIPLDIISIEIDEPFRARGALYISDRHVPDVNTTGVIDIFVRRMFVRANDNTFLPPWAKFVRGVIDSPDLQPTAARDNIQREHPSFTFFHNRLGELIVERLSYLARNEPSKFRQINLWHHYHLKGMAYYYNDFFDQVIEMLLFETNKGQMSLRDYLTKNTPRPEGENRLPIYYFAYHGAATQFYRLADAHNWVVINAGHSFEEELLERYAERNRRTVHLVRLDATDDPELFQRPNEAEAEQFRQLELDMEGNLRRADLANVMVRMRRFDPPTLPAVIILTPETEAEEKLRDIVTQPWFMPGMEEITREALEQQVMRRPIYLSLNIANPVIQKLAEIDRRDKMVREVMRGIYNSAILYSHNLLTQRNTEIVHQQLILLFDWLISHEGEIASLRQRLEQERRKMIELRQRQVDMTANRPDHILIFMITPFAETYKPIEEAVRCVFERPPYYFEVRLARDYTYKAGLLDNVREHMARAHGFIAEISELNPNVMLELGAVMLPDDGRPVFLLRSQDARKDVPADLKEKLHVPYGSPNDPVEKLENDIRGAFKRDGRPAHDGVLALMEQRRKRFLSRTLLEGLRMRLESKNIQGLLNRYTTVEDLLAADPIDVARSVGLQEYDIQAIQGELKDQLTDG